MIIQPPTYMTDYPFIVMAPRSRLVHVSAKKFSNALSRALYLHPNKFLKTQFARRMDLVSAQEEAKKLSLRSAHKQFVVLLKSGDFEVENALSIEPKMDIYSVWHKGKKVEGPVAKIKLSPQDEEETPVAKAPKRAELPTKKELAKELKQSNKEIKQKENQSTVKTENTMKTKKQKSAKKAAPKKLAKAEKETKPVKKSTAADGKMVKISTADMLKNISKGYKYYTMRGERKGESTLQKREDKKAIHEMKEVKP